MYFKLRGIYFNSKLLLVTTRQTQIMRPMRALTDAHSDGFNYKKMILSNDEFSRGDWCFTTMRLVILHHNTKFLKKGIFTNYITLIFQNLNKIKYTKYIFRMRNSASRIIIPTYNS